MGSTNGITSDASAGNRLNFSLDLRVIVGLLLIVIVAMLIIWKPWSGAAANDRTIQVQGEATLTEKPDEFVFYPSYTFKNADKNIALAALNKKSGELVAQLKKLGVGESKIKTNSSSYDTKYVPEQADDNTYTLQLTVTVSSSEMAQKVQDYLVTTTPAGAVSPQANFSDAKRKALENEARTKAVKDAKSKADQTAKDLGFKVGKVKTVSDGSGFSILPTEARDGTSTGVDVKTSLGVHPGENELPYSVTVVYFIR